MLDRLVGVYTYKEEGRIPEPEAGRGRAVLPEMEPGTGEGECDWVVPTLRIWARTWES